jgi:Fe-S-cluster containining protein
VAFKCWRCGACCRFIGFKIPALDRGDKACIHLQEENNMACAIYENRPLVCRLDPERPEEEQEKWCKLMEENSKLYVSMLERG